MVLIDTTNWIKYRNSSELATQYIVDTLGAMEASSGASKESMVVGFDATDDAIASIKAGQMAGAIAQHPDLIGSTAAGVTFTGFFCDDGFSWSCVCRFLEYNYNLNQEDLRNNVNNIQIFGINWKNISHP